jgi:hypothetical protein
MRSADLETLEKEFSRYVRLAAAGERCGPPPKQTGLQGERSRIDIVVERNRGLMIGIKDHDNSEETQFVREIKRLIEACLREKFGSTETTFRRAWDELSESDSLETRTPPVGLGR